MIASRRRAHRFFVGALAPVALGMLFAGGSQRMPQNALPDLPRFAFASDGVGSVGSGTRLWEREDLFLGWPARVAAYAGGELELMPLRPLRQPDVLVYWAPGGAPSAALPADAHLLGRLGSPVVHRFRLPTHAAQADAGELVLYSLGHQEVVATATLPALDSPGGDGR